MFNLFKKAAKVSIEQQLAELEKLGFEINAGVTRQDLLDHYPLEKIEAQPYYAIVKILGSEIQREPWTPICDSFWICDFERIENQGAYCDILKRLHAMSQMRLPITDIQDHVDLDEEERAWVEFRLSGETVHWDMVVKNDWMDP